jgi:hypothetical protein
MPYISLAQALNSRMFVDFTPQADGTSSRRGTDNTLPAPVPNAILENFSDNNPLEDEAS